MKHLKIDEKISCCGKCCYQNHTGKYLECRLTKEWIGQYLTPKSGIHPDCELPDWEEGKK